MPLEQAWAEWVARRARIPAAEPRGDPHVPGHAVPRSSPRALGSVSRAFYDPRRRRIYAAFNYPGVVSHVGAIATDTGSGREARGHQGAVDLHGDVARLRSRRSHAVLHAPTTSRYRDLVSARSGDQRTRVLMKDARIGDLAFNRADRSLWGIRHLNGICTLVRMPPPYTRVEAAS